MEHRVDQVHSRGPQTANWQVTGIDREDQEGLGSHSKDWEDNRVRISLLCREVWSSLPVPRGRITPQTPHSREQPLCMISAWFQHICKLFLPNKQFYVWISWLQRTFTQGIILAVHYTLTSFIYTFYFLCFSSEVKTEKGRLKVSLYLLWRYENIFGVSISSFRFSGSCADTVYYKVLHMTSKCDVFICN